MAIKTKYQEFIFSSSAVFLLVQTILFPLIQIPPVRISAPCSYLSIILVVLFSFLSFLPPWRDGHIVRAGLVFTLCADYFLVVDGEAYLTGVVFFIFTQACYFLYLILRESDRRVRVANIVSRTALCALLIAVAALVLGSDLDALAVVSVIYYSNLLVNVVFAFADFGREPLFAIGLLLFAMCDLCIGLDVLLSTYLNSGVLSAFFSFPYINLSWIFYQPSQVLIAMQLAVKAYNKGKIGA